DHPVPIAVDATIAALLWAAWLAMQVVPSWQTGNGGGGAGGLLPRGPAEVAGWIALAGSAGTCEGIVFPGYLHTQLTALSRSVKSGIALQAAVFAVGHVYEGFDSVVRIALYGGLLGVVAVWRRSLRPGIIAHAWSNLFPLFLR